MNIKNLLLPVIAASLEAGVAILEVYHQDFEVEEKEDKSPLTLADKRSHEIIVSHLLPFDMPILSEEGKSIDYEIRKQWDYFWIVDTLDGTKEFIKRNDEFTVNIALVKENKPVLGVIYVPVLRQLYFAAKDFGAYLMTINSVIDFSQTSLDQIVVQSRRIDTHAVVDRPYTIVGSRSHATPELEAYVEKKRKEHETVDFISAGSSLKLCRVAEGSADVYPRLGPTMEWDTAAAHAIIKNANKRMRIFGNDQQLEYNKINLKNDWFVVKSKT